MKNSYVSYQIKKKYIFFNIDNDKTLKFKAANSKNQYYIDISKKI